MRLKEDRAKDMILSYCINLKNGFCIKNVGLSSSDKKSQT
jgi:hypothetical protein